MRNFFMVVFFFNDWYIYDFFFLDEVVGIGL